MEEVLEREAVVPAGYEDIVLYDDYGRRVTNLATLQAIRESDEIAAEWRDHQLKGDARHIRECHVKGDLLLEYRLLEDGGDELITFLRAGTHSELF